MPTRRSAGDTARIRSPMIVCCRISSDSCSSSPAGFSRIASGTAILPTSWSSAARRAQEDADLVAAETVRAPAVAGGVVQRAAEPRQQGVAGRVAEAVVVDLEAVEVEHHQHVHGVLRKRGLDVDHQLAAVAEAG